MHVFNDVCQSEMIETAGGKRRAGETAFIYLASTVSGCGGCTRVWLAAYGPVSEMTGNQYKGSISTADIEEACRFATRWWEMADSVKCLSPPDLRQNQTGQ